MTVSNNIFHHLLTCQHVVGPYVVSVYGWPNSLVRTKPFFFSFFFLLHEGTAYGAQPVLQISLQLWVPTCPGCNWEPTGDRNVRRFSLHTHTRDTPPLPPQRSPRREVVVLVCPRGVKTRGWHRISMPLKRGSLIG